MLFRCHNLLTLGLFLCSQREIILSDHPDGAPTMYFNRGQKSDIQTMLDVSSQTFINAPAYGPSTFESIASIRPVLPSHQQQNVKSLDSGLETNETLMVDDITSIYSVGHLSHQQQQVQRLPKIKKIHHGTIVTEILPSSETISSKNLANDYNEKMHQELSSEDIYTLRLTSTLPLEGSSGQGGKKYESYMYDGSLNRPAFEIVSHADVKPATPIHFEQTRDLSARSHQSPSILKWKTNASFNASVMDALDKSTNQEDDPSFKDQFTRKHNTATNVTESPATIRYKISIPQGGMQSSQSSNLNYGYERQVKNTGESVDWHMAHDLHTTDWERLRKQNNSSSSLNGVEYDSTQRSIKNCQQHSTCPHNPPCYTAGNRLTYQRSATQGITPFSSVQNEIDMNESKPTATLTTSIGGLVADLKSSRTKITSSQLEGNNKYSTINNSVTYHTPTSADAYSNNAISKSTWRHFEPNPPPPVHEREQSQYKLHDHVTAAADISKSSCMLTNSGDETSSSSFSSKSIKTRSNNYLNPTTQQHLDHQFASSNPSCCLCSSCQARKLELTNSKRNLNQSSDSGNLESFLDHATTFINQNLIDHSQTTSDLNDHHLSEWPRDGDRRRREQPKRNNAKSYVNADANDAQTGGVRGDGVGRVGSKSLSRAESKKKSGVKNKTSESLESLVHVESNQHEYSFKKVPKKSSIGAKINKNLKKVENVNKTPDSTEDSFLDRSNISIIDVQYPNTSRSIDDELDENNADNEIPDLPPPIQFSEYPPRNENVSVIEIEKGVELKKRTETPAEFFFSSRKHESEDLHSSSEFQLDNLHDIYDSGAVESPSDEEEKQEAILEPSAHTSFRELNENFLNHSAFTLLDDDHLIQTSQPSSVSKPTGADVNSSIISAFGNTIQELTKYNLCNKQTDRTYRNDEAKINEHKRAPQVFYSSSEKQKQRDQQDLNVIFAKKPDQGTSKPNEPLKAPIVMSTHSAHLY